jgi:DNA processing protein
MNKEIVYQIGLTRIEGVGDVLARYLLATFGSAEAVFTQTEQSLKRLPRMGKLASAILRPEVLQKAEREAEFIAKNGIRTCFFSDTDYPQRLKKCPDAPILLYFQGNANLNAPRIVSIVGTRSLTAYGKEATAALVQGIAERFPDTVIVSGLAYGIDVQAHRAAMKNNLPTIAVLAHGLDRIYPTEHRQIALDMMHNGGLLTDFPSRTNPDRPNFICRNRIVAGLSDATIIVESAQKGGALITADIAFSYDRDVFAFPGRITDEHSAGCHTLIRQQKAALITSAADFMYDMGWDAPRPIKPADPQLPFQGTTASPSPFSGAASQPPFHSTAHSGTATSQPPFSGANSQPPFHATAEHERILTLLRQNGEMHINQLSLATSQPVAQLSALLFELELEGLIKTCPGSIYRIN